MHLKYIISFDLRDNHEKKKNKLHKVVQGVTNDLLTL